MTAFGRPGRARTLGLPVTALAELRAALAAGASPAAALVAAARPAGAGPGVLDPVARHLRAGQPLAALAPDVDTGDPAADLLVRALAVAEGTGTGSDIAVEQALAAARDEAELARLLRTRTEQARGTAVVLAVVPACVWLLLLGTDRAALGFYTTPVGIGSGVLAAALAGAGLWWSRRIVATAALAGLRVDPLTPVRPARDWVRAAAVAVPVLVVGALVAGLAAGLAAGALAAALGARRGRAEAAAVPRARARARAVRGAPPGGAAEAVELVTVALSAGLSAAAAVTTVAGLAHPAARAALGAAARRLRTGWDPSAAFADGGLHVLGDTLAVSVRWGAPAAPALRRLAADLRAERRAAVEQAAERTQLALVFPTTLLTLPAFVLGVVPPLLWTAFA